MKAMFDSPSALARDVDIVGAGLLEREPDEFAPPLDGRPVIQLVSHGFASAAVVYFRHSDREASHAQRARNLTQSPCDAHKRRSNSYTLLGDSSMFRTFAAASLLTLACAMPLQQAAAQDRGRRRDLRRRRGRDPRRRARRTRRGGCRRDHRRHHRRGDRRAKASAGANGYYWYSNGCYIQRPDGAWIGGRAAVLRRSGLWSAARGLRPAAGLRAGYGPAGGRRR